MSKVTSAEELRERYADGKRCFQNADLSNASLSNADLRGADLSVADLRYADLRRVDLHDADLSDANLSNAKLHAAHLRYVNLRGASLSNADLRAANLRNADLRNAYLRNAYLHDANLSNADLRRADLYDTDFSGAKLRNANLSSVDFGNANFSGANLCGADLTRTDLNDANFDGVKVGATILADCALSTMFYASLPTKLYKPTIDYRSIIRSRHAPGLADFLKRCGWPQVFIDYNIECALSLDARGVFNLLQSTFISFGEPDSEFAERFDKMLRNEGVETFFFPRDARPGDALVEVMYRGVHDNDRVILVCSKASLTRPAVLQETKFALDREARLGGRLLIIPVAIDDYLFECDAGESMVIGTLRDRVIADFRGALEDDERFRKQVGRLVSALKKDEARDVPEGAV